MQHPLKVTSLGSNPSGTAKQWYVTQIGLAVCLINRCFPVRVWGVLPNNAVIAQLIEHTFGRGGVVGLIPTNSTK
jgi:hypothetical protein